MKKITWLTISLLMVVALVLSSCTAATVEEEKETETVTGKVTEKEAAKVEEEEEEVVAEKKRDMILDPSTGEMVEKPRYGGTITLRRWNDPNGWDPKIVHQGWYGGMTTFGIVYDSLQGSDWAYPRDKWTFYTYYQPTEATTGWMAESWENPDPLTWIVYLREGIRYWDKPPVNGREVTADDVAYTFERLVGVGEFEGDEGTPAMETAWLCLDHAEVIDKYTVAFHLKYAEPRYPIYWGSENAIYIYPRELAETYGDDWTWDQVVGCGPYMAVDFVPSSSMTFERNPSYYKTDEKWPELGLRLPYADKFVSILIEDISAQIAAIRTGKVDYQRWWNNDQAKSFRETNPDLIVLEVPGGTGLNFRFDPNVAPYDDIKVRKAMQMAINLKEITETYYQGTGSWYPYVWHVDVFPSIIVPYEELPSETKEGFTYNPERAKALLTEAGYPNGFAQTIPVSSGHGAQMRELTDIMIAYWEAIGIESEIDVIESAVYSNLHGEHEFDIFEDGMVCWQSLPIQSVMREYSTGAYNWSDVNDPIYDEMQDAVRSEVDPDERDRLLKEVGLYSTEQFYRVSTPCQAGFVTWQPWLKGYNGEYVMQSWNLTAAMARSWVDQDLKYELIGVRD